MNQRQRKERLGPIAVLFHGISDGGVLRPGDDQRELMIHHPRRYGTRTEPSRSGQVRLVAVESDCGAQGNLTRCIPHHDGTPSGAQALHPGEQQDFEELVHVHDGTTGIEYLADGQLSCPGFHLAGSGDFVKLARPVAVLVLRHVQGAVGLRQQVRLVERIRREGGDSDADGETLGAGTIRVGKQVAAEPLDDPVCQREGAVRVAVQ